MTFKLTYATMFDPPEELHRRFDAALQRVRGALGGSYPLYVAGADRRAERTAAKHTPTDCDVLIGTFAAASAADADRALRAAHQSWPVLIHQTIGSLVVRFAGVRS